MTSQAIKRREGVSKSCRSLSRKLQLERARDRKDSSRTAWCADYWGGGVVLGLGGWWGEQGESKKSNKPFKPPGMYKNGWFSKLFALKIALFPKT
jgi:hypothetical protein